MRAPFTFSGGEEVISALKQLPKATQNNTLRRVLREAMEPIATEVKGNAPTKWGDLEESLVTGTKLNKRQSSMNRENRKVTQLHFGTSDPAGIANEFGNSHQAAQPFFRQAWESGKFRALATIGLKLADQIYAAVARRQRRSR